MGNILLTSTNKMAASVTFKEALLKGQAPDYGLYMPLYIPRISENNLNTFKDMEYHQIAYEIILPFLEDVIESEKLYQILVDAYNFEIPVQKVRENFYLMWLTKGPTASFKDFAARFMSKIMEYFARKEGKRYTVLVATSGDTGGAVANAFYGLENIDVVILFPQKEITERQRKQMTTLGGNIIPFSVKGQFDDCQAIVKKAFNDSELQKLNLTSANSINFGRLLPQIVYYFYGYSKVGEKNVVFSVPSGNFGNLMGGVFAKQMGLPVKRFIVAVNENDEFPHFLTTGQYKAVIPSRQCSSNAMNVGHPSNLARLVHLYGGWLTDERNKNGDVTKKGVLKISPDMEKMRESFVSYSITEKEVDKTILEFWGKYKILLEPHGAVAVAAVEKYRSESAVISIETADPAKFPEQIKRLIGIEPQIPSCLCGIDDKAEDFISIANDYEVFKDSFIKKLC